MSLSRYLSAMLRGAVFTALIVATFVLLVPTNAQARSRTHVSAEGFHALPGYKCIGSDNYQQMVNRCTGSEISKVWYRSKTRLCYVSAPVTKHSLPFVFRGEHAFSKKTGKLVYEMSWFDYRGNVQKRHYQKVTAKGVLCKEARPVPKKKISPLFGQIVVGFLALMLFAGVIGGSVSWYRRAALYRK